MDFGARSYSFSENEPPIVIAEVGVNHNGDPALARRLLDTAVDAGADIVKFQAFRTEREISRFAALAPYQSAAVPDAAGQFELCKALELTQPALAELQRCCSERSVGFLCSVFEAESFEFLFDGLGAKAVKLGSGELTNLPLLEQIGRRKAQVILSTGGSTLAETAAAVATLRDCGCEELVLLHCVSSYPAPANEINLRAMETLKRAFGLPVGFSDHTIGLEAALAAAALGAVAIEKHFTLDRGMQGPDHRASALPEELRRLADGVRTAWSALGDGEKKPAACEAANLPLIRKSLVAARRLEKGTRLTRELIDIKRPAHGIAPGELAGVLGRELRRPLEMDEPITWASLA
jgi:N,N'-diacetyllegionaminate synthase